MIPFREHHLFKLFDEFTQSKLPLDVFLNQYFRTHTALGSKDRSFLAKTVYGITRWKGLLDAISEKPLSWESRFRAFVDLDPETYENKTSLPKNVRCSFPKSLFAKVVATYGEEKAFEICCACNTEAPIFVRANGLKTTRDELVGRWKDIELTPCDESTVGIRLEKRIQLFSLPEFKEGFFEVQDEGSQLLAAMIKAKPGDLVLDYCSGSGGKTLAFAPAMEGKGQIFLHDIRPRILEEAKKRLKRAGVQNAQIHLDSSPHLRKWKKKMDWVLVDAPCSGTGTLRRNPDMKWKYNNAMLERLIGEQRTIFEKALSYVKPGGHIVFGTCSLLKEENQDQVEHFLKTYPHLRTVGEPFQSLPALGKMDGFFGQTFAVDVL